MSVIEILWQLNVTDTTKYLVVIGIVICTLFLLIVTSKKKNKNKNKNKNKKISKTNHFTNNTNNNTNNNINQVDIDKEYFEYYTQNKPTKCQNNYIQCVETNVKNGTDKYCYPCMNDGNAPDFAYNPQLGQWVKSTNK